MSRALLRSPTFWLGLVLLATGLLNGIGPYLRRTGLIEKERYEKFWDLHTGPRGSTRAPLGLGRRCVVHRRIEDGGADPAGGGPPARYVQELHQWELPAKALKDIVLLALVAGSLLAWGRGLSGPVPPSWSWPAAALAAVVAWHAVAGLIRGAPLMTVAGLRGFAFLGIALTAGWVTGETFRRLVPWLVGLLAFQLLFSPLELLRGIPIQGHGYLLGEYFARRACGTFVMPNTLGVFAACVVALAAGYGATGRLRALAWALGFLVVVVSGSATGLAMLAAVGVALALSGEKSPPVLALGVLGVAVAAGAYFLYLGRSDVLESLTARFYGLRSLLDAGPVELLFGRGLGPGTNAAWQLSAVLGGPAQGSVPGGGDSAVAALVVQTGIVGLVLFLAALGLAWARLPAARPLVLALAMASLTLNVTEAFPVNLVLGLLLACSGGQVVKREA